MLRHLTLMFLLHPSVHNYHQRKWRTKKQLIEGDKKINQQISSRIGGSVMNYRLLLGWFGKYCTGSKNRGHLASSLLFVSFLSIFSDSLKRKLLLLFILFTSRFTLNSILHPSQVFFMCRSTKSI